MISLINGYMLKGDLRSVILRVTRSKIYSKFILELDPNFKKINGIHHVEYVKSLVWAGLVGTDLNGNLKLTRLGLEVKKLLIHTNNGNDYLNYSILDEICNKYLKIISAYSKLLRETQNGALLFSRNDLISLWKLKKASDKLAKELVEDGLLIKLNSRPEGYLPTLPFLSFLDKLPKEVSDSIKTNIGALTYTQMYFIINFVKIESKKGISYNAAYNFVKPLKIKKNHFYIYVFLDLMKRGILVEGPSGFLHIRYPPQSIVKRNVRSPKLSEFKIRQYVLKKWFLYGLFSRPYELSNQLNIPDRTVFSWINRLVKTKQMIRVGPKKSSAVGPLETLALIDKKSFNIAKNFQANSFNAFLLIYGAGKDGISIEQMQKILKCSRESVKKRIQAINRKGNYISPIIEKKRYLGYQWNLLPEENLLQEINKLKLLERAALYFYWDNLSNLTPENLANKVHEIFNLKVSQRDTSASIHSLANSSVLKKYISAMESISV